MKKIVAVVACLFVLSYSFAQDTLVNVTRSPDERPVQPLKFSSQSGDHLMIQVSSDHLSNMPDSISSHQGGLSRGFNAYLMLDKPFRSSPKFSIAIGVGVGTSNIFFKKMQVDLKAGGDILPFRAQDSTDHFKKYKLTTAFAEVPLEFRFSSKPDDANRSIKVAVGAKFGTVVNAHTKGKTLQDKNNNTLNSFTQKEHSRRLINGTRFMGTARIGYGIISLFGAYQLNNLVKDGAGADMKLYQVGLTLSGL